MTNPSRLPILRFLLLSTVFLAGPPRSPAQSETLLIGPGDLLPRGRPDIRLLVTGPSGEPAGPSSVGPGPRPGAWILRFKPGRPGTYHVKVTFIPEATGRDWSAEADLAY